ncbi:MAG TPA: hypothetical protein VL401_02375 [Alphaproteobacteria bacterium]|jgi:hypothetical protein|nr:hypothetical protein [Alphaproteobacteria bacterium]
MKTIQEQEIWGVITEDFYNNLLVKAKKEFKNHQIKKRLAISYWNPKMNRNLETRLRITNGQSEIVQKTGAWENQEVINLKEITIPIQNNIETLINSYEVLDNMHPKAPRPIIQFENEIFISDKVELKLAKQIGKATKYTFELELLDPKLDLLKIAEIYNLRDKITKTDVNFWNKWNKEVTTMSDEISKEELGKLIKKYLK